MLKIITALIFIVTAVSLTFAAPAMQESDEWELVAKLCGKLVRIDQAPDKTNSLKISEKYRPVQNAKLLAYDRRDSAACCSSATVAAETKPDKSGTFEFKGLPSGNYWFVAMVDQQQYVIPVVVKHTEFKQPVCSEMTFTIEDSGKFALRVRAPGR